MAYLTRLLALAPLLLAAVNAQATSDNARVWATVAYIIHGEKTPSLSNLNQILTPQGAQQMLRQGEAFRSRYLISDSSRRNSSTADVIDSAPIQDISEDTIDNDHVAVFSQADEWASASAFAFLQGLYPPNEDSLNSGAGGSDLANSYAENTTNVNYPLGGYQYPRVLSLSRRDRLSTGQVTSPNPLVIQGTVGCNAWTTEMGNNLTHREDMVNMSTSTLTFYQDLFSSGPLAGTVPLESANFWRAQDIYELVNYMYNHNETVYNDFENAYPTLTVLREHATTLERAMNSNPVADSSDPLNELYTISGRRLARFVAEQFTIFMDLRGTSQKMTLMFGDYNPFLSFLATAGFTTNEARISGPASRIPEPGAAMIFELVGGDLDSDVLPFAQDLSIRFYYRASSGEDERFNRESLFSSGFGGSTIPYTAFLSEMQSRGRTENDWCHICAPTEYVNAPWCAVNATGDGSSSSSSSSSSGLSPAVAGVIGAVAMAALAGLLLAFLFFVFGFRFHRAAPHERSSGLGGFKGAEKMASDTDLAVGKGGAAQERVGSWELRDENHSPPSTMVGAGITTKDFNRQSSRELDEDRISMADRTGVKAHETF
ncbi:hypothetical protein S7711_03176 [Stachybotrys chartarum IBT 7711]|uniref:Acid phosphatase n=1 Tax=Stachybotrys chartarum (strain CBS 109288 / IBT 7711) TaxID=1280523 RepID=A0A084AWL1_STACB|nr:hypothetical protein S7711_03176 [Stachybotrys chartarum IBT 7711]